MTNITEIYRKKVAQPEERVLVSSDTDFGTLLALWQDSKPSVILFRHLSPRRPQDQVNILLSNLPHLIESLALKTGHASARGDQWLTCSAVP